MLRIVGTLAEILLDHDHQHETSEYSDRGARKEEREESAPAHEARRGDSSSVIYRDRTSPSAQARWSFAVKHVVRQASLGRRRVQTKPRYAFPPRAPHTGASLRDGDPAPLTTRPGVVR